MASDDAIAQLLRSREVILLGVDEITGYQVIDGHLNGEGLVSRYCIAILRVGEF